MWPERWQVRDLVLPDFRHHGRAGGAAPDLAARHPMPYYIYMYRYMYVCIYIYI